MDNLEKVSEITDLQFACGLQKEIDELSRGLGDIFITIDKNEHYFIKSESKLVSTICEKINELKKENEVLKQIINQQKQ